MVGVFAGVLLETAEAGLVPRRDVVGAHPQHFFQFREELRGALGEQREADRRSEVMGRQVELVTAPSATG